MFGGLAAQQRAAGHHAAVGDAGDQFADPLGHRAADGDVVLQEQRLGAAHHQVVDDHGDEVDSDGVVLVHGLGDGQLGADAVGRRRQHGLAVAAAQGEQPGESAEPAAHLGPGGLLGQRFEEFDGAVTGFDVHPGRCVGDAVLFGVIRHREQGYRRSAPLGNGAFRRISRGQCDNVTDHENCSLVCVSCGGYLAGFDVRSGHGVRHAAGGTEAVDLSQATVDGIDYITREITIAPGGSTGWHYHDGRVFGVIRQGTLTHNKADCTVDGDLEPAPRSPRRAGPTTCTSVATSNRYRW